MSFIFMQIHDSERNKTNLPLILHLSNSVMLALLTAILFFPSPDSAVNSNVFTGRGHLHANFTGHLSGVGTALQHTPKVPQFVYFCGEQSSKTLCSVSSLNGQVLIMPS